MRPTTRDLAKYYIEKLDLSGKAMEIGGHNIEKCAIDLFAPPRFEYFDLNITKWNIPNTIIGDITNCRDVIEDESFDVVFSSDVFEHIDRPWLAAEEIGRILKPGGIAIVWTLWSWRNHPCPIDYWRFSPECLEFLFKDLRCLEKGYDLKQRRWNATGHWPSGMDSVPIDALGGWREHWAVYCILGKDIDADIAPYKDSDRPLAKFLRMDTQGHVTNPELLGLPAAPDAQDLEKKIDRVLELLEGAEKRELERDAQMREGKLGELRDTLSRLLKR